MAGRCCGRCRGLCKAGQDNKSRRQNTGERLGDFHGAILSKSRCASRFGNGASRHQPRTFAKSSGATIVASDSMMNFGVSTLSLPHVIFSLGTAPEYEPKLVVESLIWQK